MDHFTSDDKFIEALEKERLSYAILLPNPEMKKSAVDELLWARMAMAVVKLSLSSRAGNTETVDRFWVPRDFQPYFLPELGAIFKKEEPEVFDLEICESTPPEVDTIVFPANTWIQFRHICRIDEYIVEDALNDEEELEKDKFVLSTINNFLMLGHCRVEELNFESKFEFFIQSLYQKDPSSNGDEWSYASVLELRSDAPFELRWKKGEMKDYARHLLREMKRLHIQEFILSPGERIIFLDLSEDIEKRIFTEPNYPIDAWLQSIAPAGTKVSGNGDLTISQVRFMGSGGLVEKVGYELSTKEGWDFLLS